MYPPTPDLLKNLHFPVHSSAQGPPRGLCPATQVSKCQNLQRPRLRTRNRRVRRGIGLLERLLEQPCERLLFQRGTRLAKQLAIQVQTQVPTQVATQFSIRPDVRRDILRETQGTLRRGVPLSFRASFSGYSRRPACRSAGDSLQPARSAKRQHPAPTSPPATLACPA